MDGRSLSNGDHRWAEPIPSWESAARSNRFQWKRRQSSRSISRRHECRGWRYHRRSGGAANTSLSSLSVRSITTRRIRLCAFSYRSASLYVFIFDFTVSSYIFKNTLFKTKRIHLHHWPRIISINGRYQSCDSRRIDETRERKNYMLLWNFSSTHLKRKRWIGRLNSYLYRRNNPRLIRLGTIGLGNCES